MERFKRVMKAEFVTEFFAGIHAVTLIWMYGFISWVWKDGNVSFLFITEMFMLGYVLAWGQKFVFWKDRVYSTWSFRLRVCLWNVTPMVLTGLSGVIFGWFRGMPMAAWLTFYGVLFIFYITIWCILQWFYKSDTKQLNTLLSAYQKGRGDQE